MHRTANNRISPVFFCLFCLLCICRAYAPIHSPSECFLSILLDFLFSLLFLFHLDTVHLAPSRSSFHHQTNRSFFWAATNPCVCIGYNIINAPITRSISLYKRYSRYLCYTYLLIHIGHSHLYVTT